MSSTPLENAYRAPAANAWDPAASEQPPTRVRYGVLAFACGLSAITYLDRVCMGSAAGSMTTDLGLDNPEQLSVAYGTFGLAYAAFEIPSGWLGDVFGPRKTLIRIVLWWSIFTALTGVVGLTWGTTMMGGLTAMAVVRFLFGMGEAGAYPNITRALHNWFPVEERGFTQGLVWMSGRMMGGLTPMIWTLLISGIVWNDQRISQPLMNWRVAFWFFGALGLVWCGLFARWFRNRPEQKAGVNAAELKLIRAGGGPPHEAELGGVPWLKIVSSRNLWCLCVMYACGAYGWYFNITYLPTFMEKHHGVKATDIIGSIYKGGPLWLGAFGCLVGGYLTDAYIRRTGNRKMGRRLLGIIGHALCAVCYFSCIFTGSAVTFFLAISLAAFFNDLTMGSAWATCQDIGQRYAAIVAGCMNTIGNLGGALAGFITAWIINGSIAARASELHVTVNDLSDSQHLAASLAGYHLNFII
ncbi:MAG TPA: MFS transporter, partial [Pirellulales bacterium]